MEVFKIELEKENNEVVSGHISGRLDTTTAPVAKEKLDQDINQNCKKIILDLQDLEYISSAGLRILLMWTKKMNERQGEMVVKNINENIMEVLEVTGFDEILHIQ